jgi:CRISPR system Cascade subunit CasE
MTHFAVVFDGLLRVTDTGAFTETLVHGLGSAKAFGFGLLSIAPIK